MGEFKYGDKAILTNYKPFYDGLEVTIVGKEICTGQYEVQLPHGTIWCVYCKYLVKLEDKESL